MVFKRTTPWPCSSGRFDKRVDIEQPTTPSTGETNPSYVALVRNVPAEVVETGGSQYGGSEYVRGRQIEAGVDTVVTIRHRSDVTPVMRLKYGSRYLNITRVYDPTGTSAVLVLNCKEVQP